MGCDIHTVFQCKRDDKWIDIPHEFEENRQYDLFAWLAGVRGMIEPICEPRGYPPDFVVQDDMHPCSIRVAPKWRRLSIKDWDTAAIWMGEHSHSWLTADEILSAEPQYAAFAYFTDEVRRLKDEFGEVRMVFGFDS